MSGKVAFHALDADKYKSVAAEQSIRGFPTIKMYFADRCPLPPSTCNHNRQPAFAFVPPALPSRSPPPPPPPPLSP